MEQFFTQDKLGSQISNVCSNFTHFLILAKDKNNPSPLGAIYCMMSNAENEHTVRVPIFGVAPEAQSRGIGKLLMRSILKQIPNAKKIALKKGENSTE